MSLAQKIQKFSAFFHLISVKIWRNWSAFSIKLVKIVKKFLIFMSGSFFELKKKTESNEPTVKMINFSKLFRLFVSNWSKWLKKFFIFMSGSFFESKETESNEPSVNIQHFSWFSYLFSVKIVEISFKY